MKRCDLKTLQQIAQLQRLQRDNAQFVLVRARHQLDEATSLSQRLGDLVKADVDAWHTTLGLQSTDLTLSRLWAVQVQRTRARLHGAENERLSRLESSNVAERVHLEREAFVRSAEAVVMHGRKAERRISEERTLNALEDQRRVPRQV